MARPQLRQELHPFIYGQCSSSGESSSSECTCTVRALYSHAFNCSCVSFLGNSSIKTSNLNYAYISKGRTRSSKKAYRDAKIFLPVQRIQQFEELPHVNIFASYGLCDHSFITIECNRRNCIAESTYDIRDHKLGSPESYEKSIGKRLGNLGRIARGSLTALLEGLVGANFSLVSTTSYHLIFNERRRMQH